MLHDNSQLLPYFLQATVMERLPVCVTLAFHCHHVGATIPDQIDLQGTAVFRALQHIAGRCGYLPLIKLLFTKDEKIPQPELYDLDLVITSGCTKAVDYLLAINPDLTIGQIHLNIAVSYGHVELFRHLMRLAKDLTVSEITAKFAMANLHVPMMQYLLENYPEVVPQETVFNPPEDEDGSDHEDEDFVVAHAGAKFNMVTPEETETVRRISHFGVFDRVVLFRYMSCFTQDEMRNLIETFQAQQIHELNT